MTWSLFETVSVLAIGKRLGLLLFIVAIYCLIVGEIVHHFDIHIVEWGGAASVINTVILSLLLSFRNRAAYDRWWEGRILWGQLTNDSRNLSIKIAAYVPAAEIKQSRVAELLGGFAEALKNHLRGDKIRLRDLRGLESEEVDPPHLPLHLAGQLYSVVADWRRIGLVDETTVWIFDRHLRGLLDVCGACERIRNTPLSPSYKTLLRAGLLLNVLAAPWLTMAEIGFWGLPVFELVCFFLLGVELIDTVVEEPFGRERDDLDLDTYCRTIQDGVRTGLAMAAP